jgi:DNA (cytosine-5)-methyltransferase 1
MIKVLNLYAGIGGNRKLWENVDVTAVENVPEIAKIYQDFFPNDKVIIADAHQYLLDHYKEFDFIWSSPPCPSHSDWKRVWVAANKQKAVYPDMKLWQEIIFFKGFVKCQWVVENVISYYEPLIKCYNVANHYFWANFHINNYKTEKRGSREDRHYLAKRKGFDLPDHVQDKRQLLRNCVEPELGLHVFNCAFKVKQKTLVTYKTKYGNVTFLARKIKARKERSENKERM